MSRVPSWPWRGIRWLRIFRKGTDGYLLSQPWRSTWIFPNSTCIAAHCRWLAGYPHFGLTLANHDKGRRFGGLVRMCGRREDELATELCGLERSQHQVHKGHSEYQQLFSLAPPHPPSTISSSTKKAPSMFSSSQRFSTFFLWADTSV